jgi:hypothetical protein
MTPEKIRLAILALTDPSTDVSGLCAELGVARTTLYRFVDSAGALRTEGRRMLEHPASPH